MSNSWHQLDNVAEIDSPALIVYPDRIAENIRRMLAIAGGAERLRPHIKTHKMSAVMRMQLEAGITKCKCATLAEAEMAAAAGADDVLLAHQPVGPKVSKLAALAKRHPHVRFSTIVDDPRIAAQLSSAFVAADCRLEALIDLDIGMGRSGIRLGGEAAEIYRLLVRLPGIEPGGLHAYDGHIRESDLAARQTACEAAIRPAIEFAAALRSEGLAVPRIVAGGTPTFPIHAKHHDRECSPGTCVLSDAGYSTNYPDLNFLVAAIVLTRVISKPGPNRLCLDLGHKAVAADPVGTRVVLLEAAGPSSGGRQAASAPSPLKGEGRGEGYEGPLTQTSVCPLDATVIVHSEEHFTIETPHAARFQVGDPLYGIPWHICPTVALHKEAIVARDGKAVGTWTVDARDRA